MCGLCYGRFEIVLNSKTNAKQNEQAKQDEIEETFKRLTVESEDNSSIKKSATTPSLFATPRQPSKFALFVKDNYNSIKRESRLASHKDVMQELSKQYKLQSGK